MYNFVDYSEVRKSEVWKFFLLDKNADLAKCKLCEAKNITKILKVKGGNTTTLKDHMAGVHKSQPKMKGQGQITTYVGRKSLGESLQEKSSGGA